MPTMVSFSPLPSKSASEKAFAVAMTSSMVVGTGRFSFSSQSVRIHSRSAIIRELSTLGRP